MKEKKQYFRKYVAVLLTLALFMSMFATVPETKAYTADEAKEKQEFCGTGYQLELSMSSEWENGCVAEVCVSNRGNEDIRNWSVVADVGEGLVENSWNATKRKVGTKEVVFECESHNMVIKPNEKISFGFQMTGGAFYEIRSLRLVQGKIVNTNKADVIFRETGSWEGNKTIEGTITNESDETLKDWSLSFQAGGEIINVWNVSITGKDSDIYYVSNCDYNAVIEPGESVTFGFQISYETNVFDGVSNVRIYSAGEEESGDGEAEQGRETERPDDDSTPAASMTPAVTETPVLTSTPEVTPEDTKEPEGEEVSENDIEFVKVDNRDWNMDMIHANDEMVKKEKKNIDRQIKVTMLDSGINYSSEVVVAERKNFVEGQEEMTCLFEDGSGHGTAIAEVLASDPESVEDNSDGMEYEDDFGKYTYYGDADEDDEADKADTESADIGDTVSMGDLLDSGYEWTEGMNPNIKLYSGKILDENNETTVDQIVEGIDWAIEEGTDILSLSVGMEKDSKKLHKAVQRAADQGILIIAASGDEGETEYPAAYPEVMSVGMADSMGKTAGVSSEVVAPGKSIVSRGVFDSMQIFSGSSMAVPHVVGLASILWQRDTSRDASFIRGLIDVSAKALEDDANCRYGMIDCKYALECYDTFAQQVAENSSILDAVSDDGEDDTVREELESRIENESELATEEEMQKLHGNWAWQSHQSFVSEKYERTWTNGEIYVEVLRDGLSFVDRKDKNPECYGMRDHPWFHGFFGGVKDSENPGKKTKKSNYITAFRTLLELADYMRRKGEVKKMSTDSDVPAVKNVLVGINGAFQNKDKIGSEKWEKINPHCAKSNQKISQDCRSLLIYGMALHTLGDTFSHSSFGMKKQVKKDKKTGKKRQSIVWKRYTHGTDKKWYADNQESRPLRYETAKALTKKAIRQIDIDKNGLAGYKNIGTAADSFYAEKQFKQLKKYCVSFTNKSGKKKNIYQTKYFNEGYALKDFKKYYEQDAGITGRTSKTLETYLKYIDKDGMSEDLNRCIVMGLDGKNLIPGFGKGTAVTLKEDGKALATLTMAGQKTAFVLSDDTEYELVCSDSEREQIICTIKKGIPYDSVGRMMKEAVTADEEEEDIDEELDETENLNVCDMVNYEPSTDCLIQGKIVCFDFYASSVSKMPGLSGVKISAVSRDTGKVYRAETEKDGYYQLQVPKGLYDITYSNGEKFTGLKQFLNVAGDKYENMTLEMMDEEWFGEGYLEGYLYDRTSGGALVDATVQVYRGVGYSEGEPADTIKTDASGYFCTSFLDAGAYTFVISKEGYVTKYYYEPVIGGVASCAPRLELVRRG